MIQLEDRGGGMKQLKTFVAGFIFLRESYCSPDIAVSYEKMNESQVRTMSEKYHGRHDRKRIPNPLPKFS